VKRTQKRPRQRSTRTECPWRNLNGRRVNLNVEDFLTFRITRLSNALRANLSRRYLEEFNLSLPEWRLLALITRFSPMRFSEVTTRSNMDKGQVSRTLRVMNKRGLIKSKIVRRGSSAAEALAAPVIVTVAPKGKALYRAVLPVAQKRQIEMLMTITESERLALFDILDKLFHAIGDVAAANDGE
jgi:DNA-binding MarR family transcriptional regulator